MQDTINDFLDVHASIFCIFRHVASQTIQELSTELMRSPQDTPWSYNKVLPNSTRKLVKEKVEKRRGRFLVVLSTLTKSPSISLMSPHTVIPQRSKHAKILQHLLGSCSRLLTKSSWSPLVSHHLMISNFISPS